MKKFLTILLCSVLLSSCGYAPIDNVNSNYTPVITDIEKVDDITCNYYGQGNSNTTVTITEWRFKFRDTIGKFQIGDTINIIKK